MTDFTRTKEDIVAECGVLPSQFIHAGAKDKITLLACMTPEQAFRLGHVIGIGKGMTTGFTQARNAVDNGYARITNQMDRSVEAYEKYWHMKEGG